MSETVRVYHNARCSKSRSACQLLADKGVTLEVVEYLKTPPSRAELVDVLKKLGMHAGDIVRIRLARVRPLDNLLRVEW